MPLSGWFVIHGIAIVMINLFIYISNLNKYMKGDAKCNKLAPYGIGGRLLLTANFQVT